MNQHYCFSDIHGIYSLWEKIRDYCDESDTIYFLGDACDRGKDGIKIMLELIEDPRVVYIKGNHEQILFDAIEEAQADERNFNRKSIKIDLNSESGRLCVLNGGKSTISKFNSLLGKDQIKIYNSIYKMPLRIDYQNSQNQVAVLTHAGTCLRENYSQRNYLWDRLHHYFPWEKEEKFKNYYVIHGHTPVPYIAMNLNVPVEIGEDEYWNVLKYADGHKIDIDLLSIETKKVALFNLDTMEVEKYFYGE